MRKILFRGKRLDNGEWVYGFPMHNAWADEWYIFPPQGIVKVDPDTIGQYTGDNDINGTPIYEGDILHHINDETTAPVSWIGTGFVFDLDDNRYLGGSLYQLGPSEYMEIVGNIHDK